MAATYNLGDLSTAAGVAALNEYLATRSYINGVYPTKDDSILLMELNGVAPNSSKYPHANRWFVHISHFCENTVKYWPKGKCAIKPVAPDAVKDAAKSKENIPSASPTPHSTPVPQQPSKNGVIAKDDDFDLFGDEEETAEAAKELAKEKAAKKVDATAAKPKKQVINRSSLVIEIKPKNVDTNLDALKDLALKIVIEGLTWGEGFKKVPIAFGLYKLQVVCTIIDDLVDTDHIVECIEVLGMSEEKAKQHRENRQHGDADDEDEDEDEEDEEEEGSGLVQSVEIVSFNKL